MVEKCYAPFDQKMLSTVWSKNVRHPVVKKC